MSETIEKIQENEDIVQNKEEIGEKQIINEGEPQETIEKGDIENKEENNNDNLNKEGEIDVQNEKNENKIEKVKENTNKENDNNNNKEHTEIEETKETTVEDKNLKVEIVPTEESSVENKLDTKNEIEIGDITQDLDTEIKEKEKENSEENIQTNQSEEEVKKSILKVSSGIYETRGHRNTMEDKYFEDDDLSETFPEIFGENFQKPTAYYAIYDGHRGTKASEYLEEYLHMNIFASKLLQEGNIEGAFREGFEKTDNDFLEIMRETKSNDGSTSAVALIIGNKIYTANCGDAEIILGRKNDGNSQVEPLILSKLHKPNDPEEKKRIISEGGMVLAGRVGGTLAVSRAFGDLDFKTPFEDEDLKMGVVLTSEPHITSCELIPHRDQFLIVGCDGVWEKLSRANSVSFVASRINEEEDLCALCEELVNYALNSGSQDNISAIIVKLKWE